MRAEPLQFQKYSPNCPAQAAQHRRRLGTDWPSPLVNHASVSRNGHARLESETDARAGTRELLFSIPSAGIRTTYRIGTSISVLVGPLDISQNPKCYAESVRVSSNEIWWPRMWPALVLRPQTKRCTVALCNPQSAPQRRSAISLSCVRRARRISGFHLTGSSHHSKL